MTKPDILNRVAGGWMAARGAGPLSPLLFPMTSCDFDRR